MDDQACRLVDHDDRAILVHDAKGHLARGGRARHPSGRLGQQSEVGLELLARFDPAASH
jgi:hypothetical protein